MIYIDLVDDFKQKNMGRLKYQTLDSYTRRLKKQILPYFDDNQYSLDDLQILEKWQYYLLYEKGYAISYANTLKNTLSSFVNYLVSEELVNTNLVTEIEKIKDFSPKDIFDFWEYEEFDKFIKCIEAPLWNCFFTVLYYSGCRIGEIRALTWKQINFKSNRILINRSISKRPNERGKFVVTLPKNNTIRSFTMNVKLSESLLEWKKMCKQRINFNEGDLVFMRSDGESLSTTTIERRKNLYCAYADVKQIRIHDFRHSNASLLINMGAPVSVVSERLGHRDKRQTLNIYSHLFPSAEKFVVEKINELTNIYNNKHEKFAKALINFIISVSEIDDLNKQEQEVMNTISRIAFDQ